MDLSSNIDETVAKQGGPEPSRYFRSGPRPMIENFPGRLTGTRGLASELVMVDAWE
jgi:hypothetical protein